MTQRERVSLTSRVFCLAAVLGLALAVRDASTIQGVVAVSMVAAMSTYVSILSPRALLLALVAEALAVGLIMGMSYPSSLVLLPYLVVLPLIAGLMRGLPGVVAVMAAEVAAGLLVPLASTGFSGAGERVIDLAPWLLTNFGAGLLGVWARQQGSRGPEAMMVDDSYESARRLLTQLSAVARRLSAGLDASGMAAQLLATLSEHHEIAQCAVFVATDGSVLAPIGYRGTGAQAKLFPNDPMVERCWKTHAVAQSVVASGIKEVRHRAAFPLRVGDRMMGVVLVAASQPFEPETVATLMPELEGQSLRIDTALAFDQIRTMATTDERQRLAREIHDGVAQEIASLGYSVDELAAVSSDPRLTEGLKSLRSELSRVIAELRLSIFDLRSDVGPTAGLGSALSDYVRQVGSKTPMTVHLTLDEAPVRLQPVVEEELFRIAQEAITNARKHACAENLWVDYWADPPVARLTVRDDGAGLRDSRDDSYGFTIMRERANRIDALLSVSTEGAPRSGTFVDVTVGPQVVPLDDKDQ